MLKIEDLWVAINGKEILRGIDLHIPAGEAHVLFGKNGSGKSSLLMAVMGFSHYTLKQGKIIFRGQDITNLPTYERARLGLGLAFQRPPTIRGVRTRDILTACAGKRPYQDLVEQYGFAPFLDREINYGFSGGGGRSNGRSCCNLWSRTPRWCSWMSRNPGWIWRTSRSWGKL